MLWKVLFLILLYSPCNSLAQSLIPSGFEAWSVAIEKRIFPGSFNRESGKRLIKLTGCRNEFVSAQLATRSDKTSSLSFRLSPLRGDQGAEIPLDGQQLRFGA